MDETDHRTCDQRLHAHLVGIRGSLHELDGCPDAPHADGDPRDNEQDVQPLKRRKDCHAVKVGGEERGAGRTDSAEQGEPACQPHQHDADEAQELCEKTIFGHCLLLS
ncbi:MAG TPA: hypothetical protein PLF42_07445 [Anaerolineales bacterium]|nr:hypothetical protein [Anaerolineales bacterium]